MINLMMPLITDEEKGELVASLERADFFLNLILNQEIAAAFHHTICYQMQLNKFLSDLLALSSKHYNNEHIKKFYVHYKAVLDLIYQSTTCFAVIDNKITPNIKEIEKNKKDLRLVKLIFFGE